MPHVHVAVLIWPWNMTDGEMLLACPQNQLTTQHKEAMMGAGRYNNRRVTILRFRVWICSEYMGNDMGVSMANQ